MISSWEYKTQDYLLKYKDYICIFIAYVMAVVLRVLGRNFVSRDMAICLIPWFNETKERGGLDALSEQTGNYGVLYQTIISLMTYINIYEVYQYKLLSIFFDILLSIFIYKIVSEHTDCFNRKLGVLAAVLFLLLPTVFLNSSFWGQCDSIYSFFCIASLYYLRKESFVKSFVCLGVAFAFKLQTLFILPFILFFYFKNRKFSILYFLLAVATFWMTGIIAFIEGRSLLAPFVIYGSQMDEYHKMYMNFPSFWALVGRSYGVLKYVSIIFTGIVILVGGYVYVVKKKFDKYFYEIVAWFVWTMLLFLPSMHERYAYLLDIIMFVMCFFDLRYIKYAFATSFLSLLTYGNYLLMNDGYSLIPLYSLFYFAMYILYSYELIKYEK